jgi:hypothetical protein
MAQPTNAASTYDLVAGDREDIADIIYDVSPVETPGLTRFKKNKAEATYHEWLVDSLTSAGTNYVIEGDEATTDAADAKTKRGNYTCISDKSPLVTGTQEKINKVGIDSEMAYQMEKQMKALKRDVEKMIWDNNARAAGNDSTAREAAGMPAWLITNLSKAGDATAATGDGTDAFTTGTTRALTESLVEAALALAWDSGGSPTWASLGSFQKRKFAAFTGNTSRTQEVKSSGKLVNSVDVYVDPLGNEIELVPNRHCVAGIITFVDPAYVKFSTLRNFFSQNLAVTGDYLRKQILVEWTLEVCNEKAHAMVTDLATS